MGAYREWAHERRPVVLWGGKVVAPALAAGTHRLAVVMFTDVVGFTARAQHDEPQALKFLDEQRRILRPRFEEHKGREIKTIGDAFLVEFDSALNATGCAVAIQRDLYERNLKDSGESLDVRIGIHLGEVSHDNGDIHGDAVNVASRIYPLADPGGICLSEPVYAQIRGKLDLAVEKLPPTHLKNVTYPVELFRAVLPWSERGLSAVMPWTDREVELDAVQKALGAAARGESSVVMLTGEVGIGKTRLADEVLERARKSGTRVLRGRCPPADLATPYAPWVEAFHQFVQDAPPPLLYRALGQNAREVARIVPEVIDKVGPLPPSVTGEPKDARHQFVDAIGQFMERLAGEGPLVLFLDDLHWADPASTQLLRYLGPRLRKHPILILGAYRKSEEEENRDFREALAELHRERLISTLTLGRFDAQQVGQLIADMFHTGEVSGEFRDLVHSRTGGNPLLVEEVLRALVRDHVIYWAGAGWERKPVDQIEIPDGVKEIILQRLRKFGEKSVDLLRLASVIGYEFDFDVLHVVSGEDEAKLLDAVENLLRGRLIQEVAAPHGRSIYLFADHPTRDVLYEQVSLVRRRRLHLKIAQTIEGLGEKTARARAPELAHHFLQGNDIAKAREYSFLSGEQAARVFAHAESYRHFQTAREMAEEGENVAGQAEAMDRMAVEALQLGRGSEPLKLFTEAAALYAKASNLEAQAEALSSAATVCREQEGDVDRALRLAREAVGVLEKVPESKELAAALVGLGVILFSTRELEEGRAVMERAAALAQKYHDVDSASTSLQFLAQALPRTESAESLKRAKEAVRIAEEGDAVRIATKLVNLGISVGWVHGDLREGLEIMERGRKAAERKNQTQYIGFARGGASGILELAGRFKEAREEATAALQSGGTEVSMNRGLGLITLGALEAIAGDYQRARLIAAEARKVTEGVGTPQMVTHLEGLLLDRAYDEGTRDTEAEEHTERLLSTNLAGSRGLADARMYGFALSAGVENRIRHGTPTTAPLLAEMDLLAQELDEPWARATRDALQGELLLSREDARAAVDLFRGSAETWRRLGLPYEEAKAWEFHATSLARCGDIAGARESYGRALGLLEGLGARARRVRVEHLRDALPTA